jgi:hypothetical protein
MCSRLLTASCSTILFISVSHAHPFPLSCTGADILAISEADEELFSSCFLVEDWSWKLSFQNCLVSQVRVGEACAILIRESAFPDFISLDTCEAGVCDVRYAIRRAIAAAVLPLSDLGEGDCNVNDLVNYSLLENTAAGDLPSAAPSNSSSTCTSCLAQEISCPSNQSGDVCFPTSPSSQCFGCSQIKAAKQMATCSISSNITVHSLDCLSRDIERLNNVDLDEVVECFADTIGWQDAVQFCLARSRVSPRCLSYMTSLIFASDTDRACVSGIHPTDEVTTSECLVPMWMRGIATILAVSAANVSSTNTCTDSDLEKLSLVTNTTDLNATITTVSTSCQGCIGTDPIETIKAGCAFHCNDTNPHYVTWGCSACMQFNSAKTLTTCSIGETPSSVAYTSSTAIAFVIALFAMIA